MYVIKYYVNNVLCKQCIIYNLKNKKSTYIYKYNIRY